MIEDIINLQSPKKNKRQTITLQRQKEDSTFLQNFQNLNKLLLSEEVLQVP